MPSEGIIPFGREEVPTRPEESGDEQPSESFGHNRQYQDNWHEHDGEPRIFSGGSFMKGLMIGGLAGMLFGGLFGNMGFFGEILGLLVNLMALFALFMLVVMIFRKFKDRRKPPRPDSGRWN